MWRNALTSHELGSGPRRSLGVDERKQRDLGHETAPAETDDWELASGDESRGGWVVTVVGLGDDDGGRSIQRVVFRREISKPTWDEEKA